MTIFDPNSKQHAAYKQFESWKKNFNDVNLYTFSKKRGARGQIIILKPIKLKDSDSLEKIEKIKKKIEDGHIGFRIKEKDREKRKAVRYAFGDLKLDLTNIEEIHVKKIDKNDPNKRELVDITVAETKEEIENWVTSKIGVMDDDQTETLQKIRTAIEEFLHNKNLESKSHGEVKHQKLLEEDAIGEKVEFAGEKKQRSAQRLVDKKTPKQVMEQDEKDNEGYRSRIRKNEKLAEEMDKKAEKIRKKAIISHQKKEDIEIEEKNQAG